MPMPIARLRPIGTARTTAWRRPVATSAVMTRPSATMTPIACA